MQGSLARGSLWPRPVQAAQAVVAAICRPLPLRRSTTDLLVAGMPYALRPLAPATRRRPFADRWGSALLALLLGLAVLVAVFGWEIRRGQADQLALKADLALATASAAATEVELRAALADLNRFSARQRDELAQQRDAAARLTADLAARTLQVDQLERGLTDQTTRALRAEADADELHRQLTASHGERDALADQLAQREAELTQLNERLTALQQRIDAMEALTNKVRQTLGLPPTAAGPAGGDLSAAAEADLQTRLAALDERQTAAGEALADAEQRLRQRLWALQQLARSHRLRPATLALAPVGWPATGRVSSPFGPRLSPIDEELRFHPGVDIAVNVGTPVLATQAGQVILAGELIDYGLTVVVRHDAGFETLYAHNSAVLVKAGQRVERGQPLARSGNTGESTGPHLHYEVRYQGRPLDPEPLLRAK